MQIQDWAAIAEIIGSVAVIASLVYLAVQIRQNTEQLAMHQKSTELAAFESNVASGNRVREMFILNPEVADLFLGGNKDFAKLDVSQKLRFGALMGNIFSELQGAYIRQLTYSNDPSKFQGSTRIIDEMIALAGVRQWLKNNEPDWRPEFHDLVQARVSQFLKNQNRIEQ